MPGFHVSIIYYYNNFFNEGRFSTHLLNCRRKKKNILVGILTDTHKKQSVGKHQINFVFSLISSFNH